MRSGKRSRSPQEESERDRCGERAHLAIERRALTCRAGEKERPHALQGCSRAGVLTAVAPPDAMDNARAKRPQNSYATQTIRRNLHTQHDPWRVPALAWRTRW
jgi:hypothetical protein